MKRYNAGQNEEKKNDNYNPKGYSGYLENMLKSHERGDRKKNTPVIKNHPEMFTYVELLAPHYKTDEAVKNFFAKLNKIKDDDLILSVYVELLKYGNNPNDTIWKHYAADNEYRIVLYQRLKEIKQTAFYPKEFADQQMFCEAFIQNRLKNNSSYSSEKKEKEKKEKLSFYKTIDVKNKREKGKIYIYKREDTRNKEERWSCVFVEDSKELSTTIDTIDLNLILSKNKTTEDYLNQLADDFYIRYRNRSGNNYSYNGYNDYED